MGLWFRIKVIVDGLKVGVIVMIRVKLDVGILLAVLEVLYGRCLIIFI